MHRRNADYPGRGYGTREYLTTQPGSSGDPGESAMEVDQASGSQDTAQTMTDFFSIANLAEDASVVYGKMHPIWTNRSCNMLVEPALAILKKIPESRGAVLHYLGMLTHEATHLYFSKKENAHFTADFGNIEKAVSYLSLEISDYLSATGLKGAAAETLRWGCFLAVEICQNNYERPIAKQAGIAPVALLPLFEKCPAVTSIIELTDKATSILLKCGPEDCLSIILDISRLGFCFDWMWLHIASKFPAKIIPHLLKAGTQEFRHYVVEVHRQQETNPVAVVELHDIYKHKFVSLSEVFTFLASKGLADLESVTRETLRRGIEALEDAETDEQLLSETADFTLAFLFKLVTNAADVLRFLVDHAFDMVTPTAVMNVARQLSLMNRQCVLPSLPNMDNYRSFFQQMVFAVSGPALSRIFDLAYPFAFDERVFEEASRKNQSFGEAMKSGAFEMLEEILGSLLVGIHKQQVFNGLEFGLLTRLGCDSKRLDECVVGALTGGERASFFIRYLHAYCMTVGPTKSWEVVARFIMKAEDEEQILSLSALLITVAPFSPTIVSEFIPHFCAIRNSLEKEERRRNHALSFKKSSGIDNEQIFDDAVDVRWLENLTILNEWGKTTHEMHPIKLSRLELVKNACMVLCDVLRWALDELYRIRKLKRESNPAEYEATKTALVNAVAGLTRSLAPMPVQPPKYTYKVCAQFAALLVFLLKDVGDEDQPASVSLFNAMCTAITDFLSCQLLYIREQFIIHLFDEILAQSKELFGGESLNVWETEECFANGGGKEDLLSSSSLNGVECESLFEQARKLPISALKPSQMAHSGIIGKGAKKKRETELKSEDWLRRLVFFENFQQFFCASGTTEPNRPLCKQLALALSDRLCKDALTNAFVWDDWEFERELTARYIIVAKRVADTPIVWDVMFALSDVYPCLWYCFPVVKAIFASILVQFENCSDQKSAPPEALTDLLDKWFLLVRKAQLLPDQLAKVFEIVVEVTYREGFLVLLDVWRYFMTILNEENTHPVAILNSLFERTMNGEIAPLQTDITRFKDTCRIVIQRNIERLGFFFPHVFAEEFSKLDVQ